MRRREVSGQAKARARLVPVLLAAFALCATFIPASRAQDGRPRRVSTAPRTAVAQQQATRQPTPRKGSTQTGAQQTQTPARTPQTGPVVNSSDAPPPPPAGPKLKTSPSAAPDEPSAQGNSNQEVDPDEVVKIDTNLVNLHVRVVDRFNRPVNDVRQDEFRVFENGVPQQLQFISKEEVPISYGLVVDNTGSLRNQINQVIEASKSIVESNKPGDEAFVVRFVGSDEVKIMQDFTADKQSLSEALDDMFVEGGQTAVIDAVYLSEIGRAHV